MFDFFLILFLLISIALNVILYWYVKKVIFNLGVGVKGVDDFQLLLNEYSAGLQQILSLPDYYQNEEITTVVKNTKMVIEACKFYKKAILDTGEEESEDQASQEQEEDMPTDEK